MKLAEALSIRADLQKRVAQLKERIKESAKVQEGDEPCDNVEELYKELDEALVQLEDLVYRINDCRFGGFARLAPIMERGLKFSLSRLKLSEKR